MYRNTKPATIQPVGRVYPNPAANEVHVVWPELSGSSESATLDLCDLSGRKVTSASAVSLADATATYDIHSLAPGMYTGRLRTASKTSEAFKLFVK